MAGQGKYDEKELTKPVNLCNDKGELNRDSIGWSKSPIFNCNLSGHWPRKKKWNYWYTMNDECLFSATISNIDYAGMVFVYFLDIKTKTFIEKTLTLPLGKGCMMPDNVGETVLFSDPRMTVDLLREQTRTHIVVKSGDFGGKELMADILVCPPDDNETLNVVIPWNDKTFQFTSKQAGLPSSGTLRVGDLSYDLRPGSTFSGLDFGRGIWPRNIAWHWATASGMDGGRRLGLNLGAKWTDGTGMTENALYVDGKLTKVSEDVMFTFDTKNLMAPWRIKSSVSDCVDLIFTPIYERVAKSDFAVIKSEVHQMIGSYSGRIKTGNSEIIEISKLSGCAESHLAKW